MGLTTSIIDEVDDQLRQDPRTAPLDPLDPLGINFRSTVLFFIAIVALVFLILFVILAVTYSRRQPR